MNIIKNRIKAKATIDPNKEKGIIEIVRDTIDLDKGKGTIEIVRDDDSVIVTVKYNGKKDTIYYDINNANHILSDIRETLYSIGYIDNDKYSSLLEHIEGILMNIGIRTDPTIKSVDSINIKVSNMVLNNESEIFEVNILDKCGTHLSAYMKDDVICNNEDAIAIAIGEYYKESFNKIKLFIDEMVLKFGCNDSDKENKEND